MKWKTFQTKEEEVINGDWKGKGKESKRKLEKK